MKKGIVALAGILVFILVPALASAQGFVAGGFPTLPGLPSFGGVGASDPYADPGPFGVAGTVAYSYQTIDLDFSTLDAGLGHIGALKHTYRFSGLELGLGTRVVSRTGVGVMARFSIVATGSTKDTENYNEGYFPPFSRHWSVKHDTYCFDGLGFYRVYDTATLVGGFRWNHLETSFDRPDGATFASSRATDEAELTTDIYQPYVGVMLDQAGPVRVLRLGIIGWPQLYGTAKYGQTIGGSVHPPQRVDGMTANVNEGYFWEIVGEFGLRNQMLMGAAASVFGTWTQYHLKGHFNVDIRRAGVGVVDDDFWNISMHRNVWTAGIRVSVPLTLPVPLNL